MAVDVRYARRTLAAAALAGCLAALPLAGCAQDGMQGQEAQSPQEEAQVSDAVQTAAPRASDVLFSAEGAQAYCLLKADGTTVDLSECSDPSFVRTVGSLPDGCEDAEALGEWLAGTAGEGSEDPYELLVGLSHDGAAATEAAPALWWWDAKDGGDLRMPGMEPGGYRMIVLVSPAGEGARAASFEIPEEAAGGNAEVRFTPDGGAEVSVAKEDAEGASDQATAQAPDGHPHTEGYGGMTWE